MARDRLYEVTLRPRKVAKYEADGETHTAVQVVERLCAANGAHAVLLVHERLAKIYHSLQDEDWEVVKSEEVRVDTI